MFQGICMRRKDAFNTDLLHFAPFLLLPSPVPKQEFERALALQPLLNELMHKVAFDFDFLAETLKNTIQVDDFTRRLFQIFETVRKEGLTQVSAHVPRLVRRGSVKAEIFPSLSFSISNLKAPESGDAAVRLDAEHRSLPDGPVLLLESGRDQYHCLRIRMARPGLGDDP